MKTIELFQLLNENKGKSLLFQYAPNTLVGANYHITEVKHIKVDSVDCGAGIDSWNETVIQLWESPQELGKTDFLKVEKAVDILNKVGKMKAFDQEATVKFEYGNSVFHTAQLFVDEVEARKDQLLIKLAVNPTDCKAKESCGVPELVSVAGDQSNSCSPGGGCC